MQVGMWTMFRNFSDPQYIPLLFEIFTCCLFFRAVRRGSSSTSLFFQETSLNALDVEKTDNFQRNVFHYAVSKPDALRTILNQLKTVKFENVYLD